ncbi:MAG TPA: YdeI/OmpD-associated family protein [Candidatus Saccharimonadales bacterium]|nr:YdeI/OmpD-associated family protein [Candidatus Saccharimonadales bacterium]
MELYKDIPIFLFETPKEFENWLNKNHHAFSAVWIKFAKKKSGAVSISYDEALEVAICYGWIDGLLNKFDEKYYVVRFTPRKKQSIWSKVNKNTVGRLIKEGKMKPSGLEAIENAKANGRWEAAYDSSATMQLPDDFLTELAKDKKAEEFFKTLTRANTYAIAFRLQTATRPETRAKRMKELLEMLKRGEKLH